MNKQGAAAESLSADRFASLIAESGVMTPAEIRDFEQSLPPQKRPGDGQKLAQRLVAANKLTKYQARAIFRGKTKGLVLGDYLVLDSIGAGGMGVVLRARHRRMDRVVAIKVLPPAAMKSPESVQRFYREVKAAARLMHPNIATAYDAGDHDGMLYLVMEHVEGKDLLQLLKAHGRLPVEHAVDCVAQTVRGLEYAHRQGIVHRDIKPGNLLLNTDGVIKILDMGLARIGPTLNEAPDARGETLTTSGQVIGTCDYMAPEQAEDIRNADRRVDVYALGCTLYRLLANRPPYRGETFIQVLLAHRQDPIPRICEVCSEMPAALDAVFQKMVAKNPGDRYGDMSEVLDALCEAVGELDWSTGSADVSSPSGGPLRSPLKSLVSGDASTASTSRGAGQETVRRSRADSDTRENQTEGGATGEETPDFRRLAGAWASAAARRWRSRKILIGGAAALVLLTSGVVWLIHRSRSTPIAEREPAAAQAVLDGHDSPLDGEETDASSPAPAPEGPDAESAAESPVDNQAEFNKTVHAQALEALRKNLGLSDLSQDPSALQGPNDTDWTVSGHVKNDADQVQKFSCRFSVTQWEDGARWQLVWIDLDGRREWPSSQKRQESQPMNTASDESSRTRQPAPVTSGSTGSSARTTPPAGGKQLVSPKPPKLVYETVVSLDFGQADDLHPLKPKTAEPPVRPTSVLLELSKLTKFPSAAKLPYRNRVNLGETIRIVLSQRLSVEVRITLIRHLDGVAARISPIRTGTGAAEKELTNRYLVTRRKAFQDAWQNAQRILASIRQQTLVSRNQKESVGKALVAPEQLAQKNAQIRMLNQRIGELQQAEAKQVENIKQLAKQGEQISDLAQLLKSLDNSAQLTLRFFQQAP